jgi:hypothetical protein
VTSSYAVIPMTSMFSINGAKCGICTSLRVVTRVMLLCRFLGFRSCVAEVSILLRYDAVACALRLLKIRPQPSLQISVNSYPVKRHHIPQEWKPEECL